MLARSIFALALLLSAPGCPELPEDPAQESCGDGVVDPDEVCDNLGSEEDGCRADCAAQENHAWELEPNGTFTEAFPPLFGAAILHGQIAFGSPQGVRDTDVIGWYNSENSEVLLRVSSAQGDGPELLCDGPAELGLVVVDEETREDGTPPHQFLPGSSAGNCASGQLIVDPDETIFVWVYEQDFDVVGEPYRVIFAPL